MVVGSISELFVYQLPKGSLIIAIYLLSGSQISTHSLYKVYTLVLFALRAKIDNLYPEFQIQTRTNSTLFSKNVFSQFGHQQGSGISNR